jgi:hypothetical protein
MNLNLNPNLNLNNQQVVNQTLIAILNISAPKTHVILPLEELVLNEKAKWLVPKNMNLFVAAMAKPMVIVVKQPEILSM